jgi:hypothetical protein
VLQSQQSLDKRLQHCLLPAALGLQVTACSFNTAFTKSPLQLAACRFNKAFINACCDMLPEVSLQT